jgi:hypothetical protein
MIDWCLTPTIAVFQLYCGYNSYNVSATIKQPIQRNLSKPRLLRTNICVWLTLDLCSIPFYSEFGLDRGPCIKCVFQNLKKRIA